MKYCADCGTPHECSAEIAADKTELAIARVQADRDVAIARLNARAAETIAETEAEHDASHAEGVAEGMENALEAVTGTGEPDEGEPIIVDAAEEPAEAPEAEAVGADNEPPVVEVAEPATRQRGGYWGAYR